MTMLPVNTAASALEMAQAMFGQGVTVASATYTGDALSSGIYSDGLTQAAGAVPADSGVILSTGLATSFTSGQVANNLSNATSANTAGVDGDAGIGSLIGRHTYDGAIFEAEFTATGDTLSMQLVFGSEEYLEWVDSGYNDVVGIWVNGVRAEMTLGEGDISIDNINLTHNANLFLNNSAGTYNTEMDGLTRVLTVKAPVNVNGTNTIRIGIADDGDAFYDSNLLIVGDSVQTAVIAHDDEVLLGRNESRVFDLLANDVVPEGEEVRLIRINGVDVEQGQTVTLDSGETLTLNEDHTVTITAAPANGSNTLNYSISTSGGTTDVAFLTITTSPVDGTAGNDTMLTGFADADGNMIDGADGPHDVIMGYGGNDKIFSGLGNDEIFGDDGNDFVRAGDGDDTIEGGNGADVLDGGTGADHMAGGAGNDVYYIDNAGDTVSELGGNGHDKVKSTISHVLADGFEDLWLTGNAEGLDGTGNAAGNFMVGNGQDNTLTGLGGRDRMYGGAGDDLLDGGSDNDELRGEAGNDILLGGAGRDKLWGGDGDDMLDGGAGNDMLVGDAGADVFVFRAGTGADVAFGFDLDQDRILIEGSAEDITIGARGQGSVIQMGADSIYFAKIDGHHITMDHIDFVDSFAIA